FSLGSAASAAKDFGYGAGGGHLSKAGDGEGPVSTRFGDSKWRTVDLPHDWVTELPFDKNADMSHGFKAIGRAYPENSIGWYRKTFDIGNELLGKRISLQFDGIFRNAQVWCNGNILKRNETGYMGFAVDLTNILKYGGKNVVTVRVDATEFEGWFYEGAGIYRHTWFNINDPVSLVKDGQFLMPKVVKSNGVVDSKLEIRNDGSVPRTVHAVMAIGGGRANMSVSHGKDVTIAPGETATISLKAQISNPPLWSVESPNLVDAKIDLYEGDKMVDQYKTHIGFKTVVWDPNKGLTINGKYTKIQGTCNHQDAAGVGSALPDKLTYWRIQQLKQMGCNAYRTSHNPPTPELLEACDKMGMLVLDETRAFGDSEAARDQLTRLIRRDRNHPSVLFWSIGNEEFMYNGSDEGARMGKAAVELAHRLDPTRVTTYAGNNGGEFHGVNSVVDIRGFNYGLPQADQYHKDHPLQPVHGSEVASTTTTRGIYVDDYKNGRVSSWDRRTVGWGSGAEEWWSYAAAREWFIGGFVWTGFDYRGEPTPTVWPTINSHFGIMDMCGFPKDIYYYYQSWWSNQPVVHIMPHWNWKGDEGKEKNVWVYSNADEVELSLNGKSLGKQKMPFTGHLEWKVTYQPGKLEAVGYKGGKIMLKDAVETTGEMTSVRLEPDHLGIMGDSKDFTVLNIVGQDTAGNVVPTANDMLE
ncbi:MAG: beta-galactosidase GalA, partial [Armatimonadota bacterium]